MEGIACVVWRCMWCGRGGDFREYANTGWLALGRLSIPATPMELTLVRYLSANNLPN